MSQDDTNPIRGIGLKILSVIVFLSMSTCVKLAGSSVPTGQVTFFRSLFAILPIFAYLAWKGELGTAFRTKSIGGQITRGVIGICAMMMGFYGLLHLPLPDAIAIGYAMPLISVVFAAIFLREKLRLYRIAAVIIGIGGVLIISWPKLTLFEHGFDNVSGLGVLAVLGSATLGAGAMIIVRKLVQTEKSSTIVLYFSMTASLFSLLTVPYGWISLTVSQAVFLICAGLAGGVAQILLTESYRYADVSTIAPFEYVSIIFGLGVSYVLFGDVPVPSMLIGTAIVIAAGIFIIYREHQLGLERKAMKKHITPQG